jgi:hypothetical protein
VALELAWNFEGTGVVDDLSGNGRTFTPSGNTVRTAAGGGYTYGGTVPTRKGLTQTAAEIFLGPAITGLNSAARTIECWAKTQGNDPSWFLELYNLTNDTGAWGWLLLNGTWSFRAKNTSNTSFPVTLTKDSANFHHLAATHDGANLKVYRDGAQVGSNVALAGSILAATAFRIFDQAGSACLISDVRIYSDALTQAQIAADMNTPVSAPAASGFTGWGVPL